MKKIILLATAGLVTMAGIHAYAADTKPSASAIKGDLVSNFRCEKLSGSLGELKLKMIENCDLDRNFTSSLTRTVGGEDIYMYCCHKSK